MVGAAGGGETRMNKSLAGTSLTCSVDGGGEGGSEETVEMNVVGMEVFGTAGGAGNGESEYTVVIVGGAAGMAGIGPGRGAVDLGGSNRSAEGGR